MEDDNVTVDTRFDEEHPHDQLPTVAEVTGRSIRDQSNNMNRKSWWKGKRFIVCISLFLFVGIGVAIIVGININPTREDRGEEVIAFLNKYSESIIDDENSPQYQAAMWIANIDDAFLSPSSRNTATFLQRYYLAVFAFALDIERWRWPYQFLSSRDVCDWNVRVLFNGDITRFGVLCNRYQEVESIILPNNNLAGELPDEISYLSKLDFLALSSDRISGTLPDNMQLLTHMSAFFLSGNFLTGTVPSWLSKWTKLDYLNMEGNFFESSIPTELGELSLLKYLDFEGNKLSGELPVELKSLSNLEFLDLGYNRLNGELPSWLDESMTKMTWLRLSNNDFQGSLSESLGKISNLRAIFLDDNQFTGDVTPLNQLTNLEYIFIEDNFFEGDILTFMENSKKLRMIDASDNMIFGSIPEHLMTREELVVLDLHANKLDGSLPSMIPLGLPLEFLSLHENMLNGEIPWASFSNLTSLAHLDLSSNTFTGGMVTDDIGQMDQLTYLFLANNTDLNQGPIPEALNALTKLEELSLKQTMRTGVIPTWIGKLNKLLLLDLDRNDLSGNIPEEIANISSLQFLLLNRNKLDGDVPTKVLSQLSFLKMLLINQNNFSGSALELCMGDNLARNLQTFTADCDNGFTCPCCTLCCTDDDCNDGNLLTAYEPIWENGYTRTYWNFTNDQGGLYFPAARP
mmetsp:Transcript_24717/g.36595  ORF Transcript_24717/g.36595 Transcript_24717/m.36595 type:complete len:687 (-) Transcript_24717:111-2171(-)